MKNFSQRSVTSFIFLSMVVTLYGQSSLVKSMIKDEIKKDLMKQIKPESTTPLRQHVPTSQAIQNDDFLEYAKKHRKATGGAEYEDKYQLAEGLTKINGPSMSGMKKTPTINIFGRGSLGFSSTVNLAGGGAKKMSEKSKKILKETYGIEVDESSIIVTKDLIKKVSSRPDK